MQRKDNAPLSKEPVRSEENAVLSEKPAQSDDIISFGLDSENDDDMNLFLQPKPFEGKNSKGGQNTTKSKVPDVVTDTAKTVKWIGIIDTEFIAQEGVATHLLADKGAERWSGTVVREMACLFYNRAEGFWEKKAYQFHGERAPPCGKSWCENLGTPYFKKESWYTSKTPKYHEIHPDSTFLSKLSGLVREKSYDGGIVFFHKGGPEGRWLARIRNATKARMIICDAEQGGVKPAAILREKYKDVKWYEEAYSCPAHIKPYNPEVHCAVEECKWYAIAVMEEILKADEGLSQACTTAPVFTTEQM